MGNEQNKKLQERIHGTAVLTAAEQTSAAAILAPQGAIPSSSTGAWQSAAVAPWSSC
jgi:hypothetical protein